MARKSLILIFLLASSIHMMSQENGSRTPTALLIIDIQEFYFPGGMAPLEQPEAAAAQAGQLLSLFRENHWPVVHIGHLSGKQQAFHALVRPIEGEQILMKDKVNAFASGELQDILKRMGVERLVVCGMQTHMCVEAAVRAGADLGYRILLAEDACATRNVEFQGQTVPASQVHTATLATLQGNYATVASTQSLLTQLQAP